MIRLTEYIFGYILIVKDEHQVVEVCMTEMIDEHVSVNLLFNHLKRSVTPTSLYWRSRRYTITKVDLHHFLREGRALVHIFSVSDGTTAFKLKFDSETLFWKLLEVDSG